MKNRRDYGRYPSRDSNLTSPESKSEALPLQPTLTVNSLGRYIRSATEENIFFYGTRNFIYVFTSPVTETGPYRYIQFFFKINFNVILSPTPHLHPILQTELLLSNFATKIFMQFTWLPGVILIRKQYSL
jgi:hypothetical protein